MVKSDINITISLCHVNIMFEKLCRRNSLWEVMKGKTILNRSDRKLCFAWSFYNDLSSKINIIHISVRFQKAHDYNTLFSLLTEPVKLLPHTIFQMVRVNGVKVATVSFVQNFELLWARYWNDLIRRTYNSLKWFFIRSIFRVLFV